MKAVLQFDLDDPVEREQHKLALAGQELESAAREFDEWMRLVIKHSDTPPDAQAVRTKFHEIFEGLLTY